MTVWSDSAAVDQLNARLCREVRLENNPTLPFGSCRRGREPRISSDLVGATGFEPVTLPVWLGLPEISLAELIGGTGLREDR
jgi:hypothetical protein